MIARYAGQCPRCAADIRVGEEITNAEGRWGHVRCAPNPNAARSDGRQACMNCGAPAEMSASLGPACPDCYDKLGDMGLPEDFF